MEWVPKVCRVALAYGRRTIHILGEVRPLHRGCPGTGHATPPPVLYWGHVACAPHSAGAPLQLELLALMPRSVMAGGIGRNHGPGVSSALNRRDEAELKERCGARNKPATARTLQYILSDKIRLKRY